MDYTAPAIGAMPSLPSHMPRTRAPGAVHDSPGKHWAALIASHGCGQWCLVVSSTRPAGMLWPYLCTRRSMPAAALQQRGHDRHDS